MSTIGAEAFDGDALPLDESLYKLNVEEKTFFKAVTGVTDDEELKKHILAAQAKAYAVRPYPCIRFFGFLDLRITKNPAYRQLLELGKQRPDALFLDVGCCFGNDVRKAIFDGYPMQNVVASDLQDEFWAAGHALFSTTPDKFTVPFVAGDVFDAAHLALAPPLPTGQAPPSSRPDLQTLTSLNPLRGHVSAIFASSLFHLFPEAQQLEVAKKFAGILSPQPGSMIFGAHVGLSTRGFITDPPGVPNQKWVMFGHSPESWKEMWDGEVFPEGTVKVKARLAPETIKLGDEETKANFLVWSVTRV